MSDELKTDAFTIDPDKWIPFSGAVKAPEPGTPIWIKLDNDRIVLAAWHNSGILRGYVAVSYEDGKGFVMSSNTAYMLRKASWQPCKFFNL